MSPVGSAQTLAVSHTAPQEYHAAGRSRSLVLDRGLGWSEIHLNSLKLVHGVLVNVDRLLRARRPEPDFIKVDGEVAGCGERESAITSHPVLPNAGGATAARHGESSATLLGATQQSETGGHSQDIRQWRMLPLGKYLP